MTRREQLEQDIRELEEHIRHLEEIRGALLDELATTPADEPGRDP
jgi:hypothetical protein